MAAANGAYDPTIIAIEIIQSLQSSGTDANNQPSANAAAPANQVPPPEAAQAAPQPVAPADIPSTIYPETAEAPATVSPATTATTAQVDAYPSNSPMNDIGPFGWVGIGFLFCLVFALIINIYLKRQKKDMDVPPTKQELEELAPGAMEG
ncbi:MAG: hypothetical protein K2H64_13045 [Desulfovibrio sp.]|nr:hypothetical protein [Desulfovibrio sp.]